MNARRLQVTNKWETASESNKSTKYKNLKNEVFVLDEVKAV